jgi:NTE family protein
VASGAKQAKSGVRHVNLGLQGGGSHGAFGWGVIDRLLADERIVIDAVTGASAGAMNAVVLAQGLAGGSRAEARQVLRAFWEGVARAATASPICRTPFEKAFGGWGFEGSPSYLWFDLLSRLASPYELNPFNLNPLRDLLEKLVDFECVRRNKDLQVFISATNVETGRARVFRSAEMTADHVLASACLPFLFQSVMIGGVPYWDGGYMGNPPLWPLFEHCQSDDAIIVQINPIRREGAPRHARDIHDRLTEITFNASLLRELRTIDFVTRLMDAGRLEGTGYRRVLVHMISDEDLLRPLGASSKLNAESAFLEMLFKAGSGAAERWLAAHFDDVGVRSTVDLRALFQGEEDALDGQRVGRRALFQSAPGREGPRHVR